jgi:hypothetical protein
VNCDGIVCAIQQMIEGGAAGITVALLALVGFLVVLSFLWWVSE